MPSTDTPLTPEFLIAHGASPTEAAALAHQGNALAGRAGPDARAAIAVELRDTPPPATPAPRRATVPVEHTMEQLEAHQDARLAQELEATFAPPASPDLYRFPEAARPPTDEDLAVNTALKAALHVEQFPAFVVNNLAANLEANARRVNATPQVAARLQAEYEQSTARLWGADREANQKTVNRYLEDAAARTRSPELAQMLRGLQSTPWLVNGTDMDALLQLAKRRAGRR